MTIVYSISIFSRVICGLGSLRKILFFLLLRDASAFPSHWGFKTPQQWQGIPSVGVNFKALDFINLVWNLIWFQDSSKKVHGVLFTSQNVTSDGGHQEACMAESLRGSCQGTAVSSWPQPGLFLTAPFHFAYFYQGMGNFQMKPNEKCTKLYYYNSTYS